MESQVPLDSPNSEGKYPVASDDLTQEEKGEPCKPDAETPKGGGDWWGGWMNASVLESAVNSVTSVTSSAVQVAKNKSSEVYGLMSKDLGEVSSQVGSTVGSAASTVKRTLEMDYWYDCESSAYYLCGDAMMPPGIAEEEVNEPQDSGLDDKTDEIADKAVETVKKSVSSFWRYASGYAQQMFTEDDLESEALVVGPDSRPVLMDRLQAQLYALASDPDTFTLDPDPEDQLDWKMWKCDLEKRQGEISDLMISNQNIRQHYTNMVPATVSHGVFWMRYFYKVHLIEIQEAKRQALKKRAEQTRLDSDSGINWDDVGDMAGGADGISNVAIPDSLQDKLLSDYERELITKKLKKGGVSKKTEEDVTLRDEMERLNLEKLAGKGSGGSSRNSPGSAQEKESVASSADDWEKLSDGEKSPKKSSKEEEEWVKP